MADKNGEALYCVAATRVGALNEDSKALCVRIYKNSLVFGDSVKQIQSELSTSATTSSALSLVNTERLAGVSHRVRPSFTPEDAEEEHRENHQVNETVQADKGKWDDDEAAADGETPHAEPESHSSTPPEETTPNETQTFETPVADRGHEAQEKGQTMQETPDDSRATTTHQTVSQVSESINSPNPTAPETSNPTDSESAEQLAALNIDAKTNQEISQNWFIVHWLGIGLILIMFAAMYSSLLAGVIGGAFLLCMLLFQWPSIESFACITLTLVVGMIPGVFIGVVTFAARSHSVMITGAIIGLIAALTGNSDWAQYIFGGICMAFFCLVVTLFNIVLQVSRNIHDDVRAPLRPGKREVTPERQQKYETQNRTLRGIKGAQLAAIVLASLVITALVSFKATCDYYELTKRVVPPMQLCSPSEIETNMSCFFTDSTSELINALHFIQQTPVWNDVNESSFTAYFAALPSAARSVVLSVVCMGLVLLLIFGKISLKTRLALVTVVVVLSAIVGASHYLITPHNGTSHLMWLRDGGAMATLVALPALLVITLTAILRKRLESMFSTRRLPAVRGTEGHN